MFDTECTKCGKPEAVCEGCPGDLIEDAVLAEAPEMDRCPTCWGTGIVRDFYGEADECPTCEGAGRVAFNPPY